MAVPWSGFPDGKETEVTVLKIMASQQLALDASLAALRHHFNDPGVRWIAPNIDEMESDAPELMEKLFEINGPLYVPSRDSSYIGGPVSAGLRKTSENYWEAVRVEVLSCFENGPGRPILPSQTYWFGRRRYPRMVEQITSARKLLPAFVARGMLAGLNKP